MTGKSKTESERRAMRERCEKIAAKYRDSDENTTDWLPDWDTRPGVAPVAELEPSAQELAEAAERRKRLYGGS